MNIQTPIPARATRRWPWLLLLPIVAGIVFTAVQLASHSTPTGPADRVGTAEATCRTEVLTRLKAPSTAQFASASTRYGVGQTADFYTVTGEVDAQNGFGALLRTAYRCDVTREQDATWRVTSVAVG